jgi:hypothetical protein
MLWAIAVIQAVSFFGDAVYSLVAWIRERPDPEAGSGGRGAGVDAVPVMAQ